MLGPVLVLLCIKDSLKGLTFDTVIFVDDVETQAVHVCKKTWITCQTVPGGAHKGLNFAAMSDLRPGV